MQINVKSNQVKILVEIQNERYKQKKNEFILVIF